jgi:hypothetical protein
MGEGRRQFTDEFKRETVTLLASRGRPLTKIVTELGIQPTMLRNWVIGAEGGMRGRRCAPARGRRPRIPLRTRRPRSFGFAARTIGCARSVTFKKTVASSRNPRNEVPPIQDHRGVWPVRVMCGALSVSPSGYYAWRSRYRRARARWPIAGFWTTSGGFMTATGNDTARPEFMQRSVPRDKPSAAGGSSARCATMASGLEPPAAIAYARPIAIILCPWRQTGWPRPFWPTGPIRFG